MDSNKILNEKDPFLREIWNMGYNRVIQNPVTNDISLLRDSDQYEKRISKRIFMEKPFTIKGGLNRAVGEYYWLADSDGSCARFQDLIKPDFPADKNR